MNYEIRVTNRDGKLYLVYYQNGRKRKSTGLTDTKSNRAYLEREVIPKLKQQIANGEIVGANYSLNYFLDLVMKRKEKDVRDSTMAGYNRSVKKYLSFFDGNRDIRSIKVLDIEMLIEYLNISGQATRQYLIPLKKAFDLAIKRELMAINPVVYADKPKANIAKRRVYTVTQMQQLLDRSKGQLKTFLYIAFFTGMRCGEIIALTPDDVDMRGKKITVTKSCDDVFGVGETKTGKSRTVPILGTLHSYFEENPFEGFDVRVETIRVNFHRLCSRLGFFCEGLHNTRHTFISLMSMARENPLLIQNIVGHSSLKMINDVYSHYIQGENDFSAFDTLLTQQA